MIIEEKTVCKECNFLKELSGQHGIMYSWSVKFENGISGIYISKTKEDPKFKVGESYPLEVEEKTSQKGVKYNKIKPYNPKPQSNGDYGNGKSNQKGSNSGYALSYAKDIAASSSTIVTTKTELFALAEEMYNWLNQRP